MKKLHRLLFVATVIGGLLSACANSHENFVEFMQVDVGKPSNDPYIYRNRYQERLVTSRTLANGNLEEELRAGRRECRVFFEVDPKIERVVSWRYQGSDKDCAIPQ
jgi:hypothetical protein